MGGVDQIIDKHRLQKLTETNAEASGWGTRRRIATGSLFWFEMGLWPERRDTEVETGDVPGSERFEVVFSVFDMEALLLEFFDYGVPKKVQRLAWVLLTQGFLDHDPEKRASHVVAFGPALFPLIVP